MYKRQGNKQTKAGGDDALDKALTRNACNNRHAEQADHKVLRRAELCRNFCDLRAEEAQQQRSDDNAKDGPDRMVNGVNIQTKYCPDDASSVQAAFENG